MAIAIMYHAEDAALYCKCGKKIGDLIPHIKYPTLQMLNLGNQNVAENYHGRCGVCGAGIHFDWRWELAAKAFGQDVDESAKPTFDGTGPFSKSLMPKNESVK